MDSQRSLEERIELLEAQLAAESRNNRMVKTVYAVATLACLAFLKVPLASSAGTPKSVTAQEFLLVDRNGAVLADLQGSKMGPLLTMSQANGHTILQLGTFVQSTQFGTSGEGLRVYDGNEVLAGNGVPRAGIGVSSTGIGSAYFDTTGTKILAGNGVTPSDTSWGPVVYDQNGVSRGGVIYDTVDNFVGLFVNDSNGTSREFSAFALDGSYNAMGLKDSTGTNEVVNSETSGVGSVATFSNGTQTGHLP